MKTVWKYWWGWQLEKMEQWLETMALQGYRFDHATCSGIHFYFKEGDKVKLKVVIDYQEDLTEDYLTLIKEDGWTTKQICPGWWLHEQVYIDKAPVFYYDETPRIEMLEKQFRFLSRIFLLFIISSTYLFLWQYFTGAISTAWIGFLLLPIYPLYLYMLLKLRTTIKKLKAKQAFQAK